MAAAKLDGTRGNTDDIIEFIHDASGDAHAQRILQYIRDHPRLKPSDVIEEKFTRREERDQIKNISTACDHIFALRNQMVDLSQQEPLPPLNNQYKTVHRQFAGEMLGLVRLLEWRKLDAIVRPSVSEALQAYMHPKFAESMQKNQNQKFSNAVIYWKNQVDKKYADEQRAPPNEGDYIKQILDKAPGDWQVRLHDAEFMKVLYQDYSYTHMIEMLRHQEQLDIDSMAVQSRKRTRPTKSSYNCYACKRGDCTIAEHQQDVSSGSAEAGVPMQADSDEEKEEKITSLVNLLNISREKASEIYENNMTSILGEKAINEAVEAERQLESEILDDEDEYAVNTQDDSRDADEERDESEVASTEMDTKVPGKTATAPAASVPKSKASLVRRSAGWDDMQSDVDEAHIFNGHQWEDSIRLLEPGMQAHCVRVRENQLQIHDIVIIATFYPKMQRTSPTETSNVATWSEVPDGDDDIPSWVRVRFATDDRELYEIDTVSIFGPDLIVKITSLQAECYHDLPRFKYLYAQCINHRPEPRTATRALRRSTESIMKVLGRIDAYDAHDEDFESDNEIEIDGAEIPVTVEDWQDFLAYSLTELTSFKWKSWERFATEREPVPTPMGMSEWQWQKHRCRRRHEYVQEVNGRQVFQHVEGFPEGRSGAWQQDWICSGCHEWNQARHWQCTRCNMASDPGFIVCPFYISSKNCRDGADCEFYHQYRIEGPLGRYRTHADRERFETENFQMWHRRPTIRLCREFSDKQYCKHGSASYKCKYVHNEDPKSTGAELRQEDVRIYDLVNEDSEIVQEETAMRHDRTNAVCTLCGAYGHHDVACQEVRNEYDEVANYELEPPGTLGEEYSRQQREKRVMDCTRDALTNRLCVAKGAGKMSPVGAIIHRFNYDAGDVDYSRRYRITRNGLREVYGVVQKAPFNVFSSGKGRGDDGGEDDDDQEDQEESRQDRARRVAEQLERKRVQGQRKSYEYRERDQDRQRQARSYSWEPNQDRTYREHQLEQNQRQKSKAEIDRERDADYYRSLRLRGVWSRDEHEKQLENQNLPFVFEEEVRPRSARTGVRTTRTAHNYAQDDRDIPRHSKGVTNNHSQWKGCDAPTKPKERESWNDVTPYYEAKYNDSKIIGERTAQKIRDQYGEDLTFWQFVHFSMKTLNAMLGDDGENPHGAFLVDILDVSVVEDDVPKFRLVFEFELDEASMPKDVKDILGAQGLSGFDTEIAHHSDLRNLENLLTYRWMLANPDGGNWMAKENSPSEKHLLCFGFNKKDHVLGNSSYSEWGRYDRILASLCMFGRLYGDVGYCNTNRVGKLKDIDGIETKRKQLGSTAGIFTGFSIQFETVKDLGPQLYTITLDSNEPLYHKIAKAFDSSRRSEVINGDLACALRPCEWDKHSMIVYLQKGYYGEPERRLIVCDIPLVKGVPEGEIPPLSKLERLPAARRGTLILNTPKKADMTSILQHLNRSEATCAGEAALASGMMRPPIVNSAWATEVPGDDYESEEDLPGGVKVTEDMLVTTPEQDATTSPVEEEKEQVAKEEPGPALAATRRRWKGRGAAAVQGTIAAGLAKGSNAIVTTAQQDEVETECSYNYTLICVMIIIIAVLATTLGVCCGCWCERYWNRPRIQSKGKGESRGRYAPIDKTRRDRGKGRGAGASSSSSDREREVTHTPSSSSCQPCKKSTRQQTRNRERSSDEDTNDGVNKEVQTVTRTMPKYWRWPAPKLHEECLRVGIIARSRTKKLKQLMIEEITDLFINGTTFGGRLAYHGEFKEDPDDLLKVD